MDFMPMRNELVGDDPITLFQDWLAEAHKSEPNDPNAAALATASGNGIPNVRMVLVKNVTCAGFSFYTNAGSQKGHELQDNPNAALCFHWKSLRRQVRVLGTVTALPRDVADQYFHSRSRASQISASVSHQSSTLVSRESLEGDIQKFTQTHPDGEIPRPDLWRGYLIGPTAIEFWIDGADRLHDRRLFQRTTDNWTSTLLYP